MYTRYCNTVPQPDQKIERYHILQITPGTPGTVGTSDSRATIYCLYELYHSYYTRNIPVPYRNTTVPRFLTARNERKRPQRTLTLTL